MFCFAKREMLGEFIGTFLLVLFGCGAVAVSILFDQYHGIFQMGITWGIGVTLAIYLTRHLSCAHLNPAVTIAMIAGGRMKASKLLSYLLSQFIGAFTAGLVVYLLFSTTVGEFETLKGIVRGSAESVQTARFLGEYYSTSMWLAIFAEGFGTFLLVFTIFSLTENCNAGKPSDSLTPLFIGLTVCAIICLIAPLTQAGLNPARDFGPRMVAWIMGWGDAAFPDRSGGFFWVYILAPAVGATLAALFFTKIVEPVMKDKKGGTCDCDK